MLFTIICTDKPDALALRQATRDRHLAYLTDVVAQVVHAGPMMSPDGVPCGSLLIVEAPDREAAATFAAADPYAQAGLFESVVIREHIIRFRDGALVG